MGGRGHSQNRRREREKVNRLMPMVPIIVFSEYGDVFSEREAPSSGISGIVSKTEHLSVLLDKARARLCSAVA